MDGGGGVVIGRIGGNVLPLFQPGRGGEVAEWLGTQSGLTQMIVPEPQGMELGETGRLPAHRAPVAETLAELRELRAEPPDDLRAAGPPDAERLAPLYRPQTFHVAQFLPFPERFRIALATGRFCYLERDGRPVAACHTLPEAEGIGQIMGVVADPAYRGRGLGRAVVAGLCRILLDEGIRPRLFYETHDETAGGLYRSLGFERRVPYLTVDFLEKEVPC
jgi:ribosomal protein S18 acetylase RimI-like enzyme